MNTFVRSEASVERFLTFGINPDGSAYEGMGKNQLEIEIIIALAKRGFWSLASLSVRNHILRFYSAHLLPSGTNDIDRKHPDWCFTWDEAIGGTYQPSRYADVAAFKHSYPTNPVADVLYRAELQDCTSRLWDFNLRFPFKAMEFFSRIICMEVPNRSKPFLNMYAENMKNLPLTYFTDYQGRMVTQSSWQCHATQLHFQPRHVRGGHAHCDRNKIAFYSLKKCWIEDTGSNSASSFLHSVVVIDNNEGKPGLLPAKTIAFADTDIATFAAGDARAAYATTGPKCSQYVPFTHNDFRFTKLDRPFYDVPTVHLPNWETGNRRGPREQVRPNEQACSRWGGNLGRYPPVDVAATHGCPLTDMAATLVVVLFSMERQPWQLSCCRLSGNPGSCPLGTDDIRFLFPLSSFSVPQLGRHAFDHRLSSACFPYSWSHPRKRPSLCSGR